MSNTTVPINHEATVPIPGATVEPTTVSPFFITPLKDLKKMI